MREQGYILPKSYRRLGLGFFIVSVLALASVAYLIWAKVVIIIHPNIETISQDFIFDVKEGANLNVLGDENIVPGKVRSVAVSGNNKYGASGSKTFESNVVGEVIIVNNYSKEQTLIETTRLAASDDPDKVLVRINQTVVVGPGEKVKVQVYPEGSSFEKLEPQRLIIPGLWGPLQDKIFAEVEETLTPGAKTVSVVTQEDFNSAETKLKEELYQQALLQINDELEPQEALWPKLFSSDVKEKKFDVTVGQEVSEFTVSMSIEAIVVVFDESQLLSLARDRIKSTLPSGKQLVNLDPKSFSYNVEQYDLAGRQANVKASLKGISILASSAELLDKTKLTGLTKEEVQEYFKGFAEVESVEVKFQPAWLKKTPQIAEKIEVRISQ